MTEDKKKPAKEPKRDVNQTAFSIVQAVIAKSEDKLPKQDPKPKN